jgi:hypothetical protein
MDRWEKCYSGWQEMDRDTFERDLFVSKHLGFERGSSRKRFLYPWTATNGDVRMGRHRLILLEPLAAFVVRPPLPL